MNQPQSSPQTAADIMTPEVITIASRCTLQDAMRLMVENHVTGLPVVDTEKKCVGLITASNVLAYEREFSAEADAEMVRHFNPDTQKWESVRASSFALTAFGEVLVENVMEPDVIFVKLNTPIREVAQVMGAARIHRVFVRDAEYHLRGVVSAFDFVRLCSESN